MQAEPNHRATDSELAAREADALELLAAGHGTAFAAQILAERYSVSLRQARRYVAAAALDLCEPARPDTLDTEAMVSLHRLSLIAGRAMAEGDTSLAMRATKAHAGAVAQLRRAIAAPAARFRLPTARSRASPEPPQPGPLPDSCPF